MANKTVILNSQGFAGVDGLVLLLLHPVTGSIGNGSGDVLTAGSNGQFSTTVTEAITGWWNVVVKNGSTSILEGGRVFFASDAVGNYLVDDPDAANINIADAVWDELLAGHSVNGSFGARILIASNSQREVQVTGSNHVAADVHAMQADVVTASALAASAVSEIQVGLALESTSQSLVTAVDAIPKYADVQQWANADDTTVQVTVTKVV